MRFALPFAMCAALALPGAAPAQDAWAIPFSLERIEAYYALYGPSRLVQAQIVLREGGRYDGPLDGQWGAETAAAFAGVIETLIAINGGAEFAVVRGPDAVPRVTDWVGSVILAEGGFGDTPD
jgi:hypothetical protein